jgi:cytochrome c biogenesis factor
VILVGELALWVALLMVVWSAIVSFAGGHGERPELIASGKRAVHASFACVVLATAGLLVALASSDFSFEHVASFTSANLPGAYKLSALWAGKAGSLLFWTFLLSVCSAIVVSSGAAGNRALSPYVAGTLSIILLVSLAAMCFGANPYERLPVVPPEGRGMSPHFQNVGMLVHPPSLYLGYVSTAIPFAFAIAALLTGKLDDDWLDSVQRWSLFAWLALTIGIMTGMWWAYVEQDRGGAWAWDSIRNAAFLPWSTTTVLLYLMLRRERTGLLRKEIVILAASSFVLAATAMFIAKGGIISTVSSLARSDARSWTAACIGLVAAAVVYLVVMRLRRLRISAQMERSTRSAGASPLSSVMLMGIALALASGTLLPMLTAARGSGKTVDGTVDAYVVVGLVVGALVLAAIVRESLKLGGARRGDYGAFAVRVGVLILAIAFAGFAFKTERSISLGPGESATLVDPYGRHWTFVSQGVSDFEELNRHVVAVPLRATHHDQPLALLRSERRQYVDSRGNPTYDPSTKAGIHSSWRQDTYVMLASVSDDRAVLRIAFNPLVMWVWIGGLVIAIGGLGAMWPRRRGSGG